MLKLILLSVGLTAIWAKSVPEVVPIVSLENYMEPDGHFHYSYETGDGSKVVQNGLVKEVEKGRSINIVSGSFEYTSKDGKVVHVDYEADENGYMARGDHIPAVPQYVLRALEWQKSHPVLEKKI